MMPALSRIEPFVHRFTSSSGQHYLYDVNTNSILSAEPLECDIVPDLGLQTPDILAKWGAVHPEEVLRERLTYLREFQAKGILSTSRPAKMIYPTPLEDLGEALDKRLHQLLLNITERCNLRCKYCAYSGSYHYERMHSNLVMRQDVARRAIDFFMTKNIDSQRIVISYYGGEPLLAFDLLCECTEYAKSLARSRDLILSVDTNGTSLDVSKIEYLVKNDFIIQVSLDGPSEVHDRYRVFTDGRGTHGSVLRNIDYIRTRHREFYDRRVVFIMTLAPPIDLRAIEMFFQADMYLNKIVGCNYVDANDTSFFADRGIAPRETIPPDGLLHLDRDYEESLVRGREPTILQKGLFQNPLVRLQKRDRAGLGSSCPPNGNCTPGVRRLFVDTCGTFHVCERVGGAFVIGDVWRGFDYAEVERIMRRYVECSEPECVRCWGLRLCSLCFATARKGSEWSFERKRSACQGQLDAITKDLRRYVSVLERNPAGLDGLTNISIC